MSSQLNVRSDLVAGDGEFDVRGFVDAIRRTGATVPWSLEVCSTEGWANPAQHVARIADGMRAFL